MEYRNWRKFRGAHRRPRPRGASLVFLATFVSAWGEKTFTTSLTSLPRRFFAGCAMAEDRVQRGSRREAGGAEGGGE